MCALLAELEEVLLRPKFRRYLDVDQAQNYVALVGRIGEHHPDPVVPPDLTADPDDDYLVALTQAAGADYLISGDPHLAGLTGIAFPVLSPRAFLERLGSGLSSIIKTNLLAQLSEVAQCFLAVGIPCRSTLGR